VGAAKAPTISEEPNMRLATFGITCVDRRDVYYIKVARK